jgi:putative membrane protein
MLVRWLLLALGVMLATRIVPGIRCEDAGALVWVVILLSFFNAVVFPVLVVFTLPFILVTMGLGIVVINAILFLIVGRLVDGFHVGGFWSAVGGSLVVSATSFVLKGFLSRLVSPPRPPAQKTRPPDDVIDI